jgi:hypothetical protein
MNKGTKEQRNKGTKEQRNKGTKKSKFHPIGSGITRSPGLVFMGDPFKSVVIFKPRLEYAGICGNRVG